MSEPQQPHHSASGGSGDSSQRGESVPLRRPTFNIFARGQEQPGEPPKKQALQASVSMQAQVPEPMSQVQPQMVPGQTPQQPTQLPAGVNANQVSAQKPPSQVLPPQSTRPVEAAPVFSGAPKAPGPAPVSQPAPAMHPQNGAVTGEPVSGGATAVPTTKPDSIPEGLPNQARELEQPQETAPSAAVIPERRESTGPLSRVTVSQHGRPVVRDRPGSEPGNGGRGDAWSGVSDYLPFGIILFDSQQNIVEVNRAHQDLLGISARDFPDMEAWLERVCPNADYAARVLDSWREHVWRKQLKRTFSLKGVDQKLREIEFTARLMDDGGLLLTQMDVTEQRRSESQLRMGEKKFRAVFQNNPGGLVLVDQSGGILDANPVFEEIAGKPVNQLRQMAFTELLVPQDGLRLRAAEEKLAAGNPVTGRESERVEVRFRMDGESPVDTPPRKLTLCPVRDDDGKVRMALYFLEVQEHREVSKVAEATPELEGQLKHLNAQIMALLNVVPDMILLLDERMTLLNLAPPSGDWSGPAPQGSWQNCPVADAWPELGEALQNHVSTSLSGKVVRGVKFPTGDGQFQLGMAPCGDNRVLVMVNDCSDVHRALAMRSWRAEAIECVSDAILVTDLKGTIRRVNPATEAIFGHSKAALIGRGVSRLFSRDEESSAKFNRKLSRSLNKTGGWEGRCEFYRKDGSHGVAEVKFSAVSEEGAPKSLVVVLNELRGERGSGGDTCKGGDASGSACEGLEHEHMQHRFRNQLQMVTSLFAIEQEQENTDEGQRMENAGDRWQVRLRALAQTHAHGHPQDDTVWLLPLIRSISDEAASVAGRGPGRREVVVSGSDSFRIEAEVATAFSLMMGEIVWLALNKKEHHEGPEIFLELSRKSASELSILATSGSGGLLFPNSNESTLASLKNLVQQLRGRMQLTQNGGSQALNVIISSGVKLGDGA